MGFTEDHLSQGGPFRQVVVLYSITFITESFVPPRVFNLLLVSFWSNYVRLFSCFNCTVFCHSKGRGSGVGLHLSCLCLLKFLENR